MTRLNFFQAGLRISVALMLLITTGAAGAETADVNALRQAVAEHLQEYYAEHDEVVINVGTLDPRLRLGACDRLSLSVKEPPQGHGNVTVKMSCESGQRWTIYVPATVDIYASAAVAARTLSRGHRISEGDISFQRTNIAQLGHGHVADVARLVGLELQRPMRAGEAFHLANLEQPEVIKRGDSLVVEAQAGGLTVVAPGRALSNGQVGEQIRVENTQSERIIKARVVGPGRVRVML